MNSREKQYAIYKFDFCKASSSADGAKYLNAANTCLASLFDQKTIDNLSKTNGRGETARLSNDVMKEKDGIYVWRVNNSQWKRLWRRGAKDDKGLDTYDEQSLESTPFAHVLIDNRPDHCLMAIERDAAWNRAPDKLRDVVQENLNHLLTSRYGLKISIEARVNPLDVWDYTHARLRSGDFVQQVKFEFRNPKKWSSGDKGNKVEIRSERLRCMQQTTELNNAIRSVFKMDYDEEAGSEITNTDDRYRDITEMANLCRTNGYDLTIKFKKAGIYRAKGMARTFYPLTDWQRECFINGCPVTPELPWVGKGPEKEGRFYRGEMSLDEWFDFVEEKTREDISESEAEKRGKAAHQ